MPNSLATACERACRRPVRFLSLHPTRGWHLKRTKTIIPAVFPIHLLFGITTNREKQIF